MRTEYIYEFGRFKLEPAEHLLLLDGAPVPLTHKAFQVLLVLVCYSGHLVERAELVNAVWGESFIEEGNLTVTISMLRKALGDDRYESRFIETVAKEGYRFLPHVTRIPIERSDFPGAIGEPQSAETVNSAAPRPIVTGHSSRMHIGGTTLLFAALIALVVIAAQTRSHAPVLQTSSHIERFIVVSPFAVAPFSAGASDTSGPLLGRTIAADLAGKLGTSGGLEVRLAGELTKDLQRGIDRDSTQGAQEVEALLTGIVEATQSQVRITAKLSNADGDILWTSSYEAPFSQIHALEDQISTIVNEHMQDFVPTSQSILSTRDPEAQRLYVLGMLLWNERTETGLRRSIECFQQALFRDPNFAEAYAGLANSYVLLASYSVEPPVEAYPNAKAAALKALQLNSSLAQGHIALGMIALYYEWNWPDAEREFKKAINLAPGYAGVYTWDSLYLATAGETSQALQEALKAHQIDPESMAAILHLGSAYYWDHQYVKAAQTYRYALAQDETYARAHSRLGMVLAAQKDYAGAIDEFQETERLSGTDPYTDGLIGYAEALRGNTKAARKILDDLTVRSQHEYVPAFSLAILYLGLGNRDKAFKWLDRACQDRSTYLVYAKVAPLLDPLRSDRRFDLLLENMGLQAPTAGDGRQTSASIKTNTGQTSLLNSLGPHSTVAAVDPSDVRAPAFLQ